MPSTLHVTAIGTLIGAPAAASSRTSEKAISRQIALRQIGGGLAQDLVLLLQQPVQLPQLPQLGRLVAGHAGPGAVLDVGGAQPIGQAGFGDPEILCDLFQRCEMSTKPWADPPYVHAIGSTCS
jgi:hypothetical protein